MVTFPFSSLISSPSIALSPVYKFGCVISSLRWKRPPRRNPHLLPPKPCSSLPRARPMVPNLAASFQEEPLLQEGQFYPMLVPQSICAVGFPSAAAICTNG